MIRVAAVTAAFFIIFLAAAFFLVYRVGKRAGEKAYQVQTGVRQDLYRQMAAFINDAVNGTSLDTDYVTSLSPKNLERGLEILSDYRRSIGR